MVVELQNETAGTEVPAAKLKPRSVLPGTGPQPPQSGTENRQRGKRHVQR